MPGPEISSHPCGIGSRLSHAVRAMFSAGFRANQATAVHFRRALADCNPNVFEIVSCHWCPHVATAAGPLFPNDNLRSRIPENRGPRPDGSP